MRYINNMALLAAIVILSFVVAYSVYGITAIPQDSETTLITPPAETPVSGCFDSDGGVYPYVKGYCVDYVGVPMYDAGLDSTGAGLYDVGVYASEVYCLTDEMRQYCKTQNTEAYCNGLSSDRCYAASLLPPSFGVAYTYFPFKSEYLCTMGFSNGACNVPVCGDGIINGGESCDGTKLGGNTCASVTGGKYPRGTLQCTSTCKLDASKCAVKGTLNTAK